MLFVLHLLISSFHSTTNHFIRPRAGGLWWVIGIVIYVISGSPQREYSAHVTGHYTLPRLSISVVLSIRDPEPGLESGLVR